VVRGENTFSATEIRGFKRPQSVGRPVKRPRLALVSGVLLDWGWESPRKQKEARRERRFDSSSTPYTSRITNMEEILRYQDR
jgi:hypothetical protein